MALPAEYKKLYDIINKRVILGHHIVAYTKTVVVVMSSLTMLLGYWRMFRAPDVKTHIAIDGMYKVSKDLFPLIQAGHRDCEQRWNLLCVGIVSVEEKETYQLFAKYLGGGLQAVKTLLIPDLEPTTLSFNFCRSDGSTYIRDGCRAGFKESGVVYNEDVWVYCWIHIQVSALVQPCLSSVLVTRIVIAFPDCGVLLARNQGLEAF
jgi:hypothetical protein